MNKPLTKPRWWNPLERPNWWGSALFLSCIVLLPISEPLAIAVGVAGGALLLRERAREVGGYLNFVYVAAAAISIVLAYRYFAYGEIPFP